jgi:hypothetical protein
MRVAAKLGVTTTLADLQLRARQVESLSPRKSSTARVRYDKQVPMAELG